MGLLILTASVLLEFLALRIMQTHEDWFVQPFRAIFAFIIIIQAFICAILT